MFTVGFMSRDAGADAAAASSGSAWGSALALFGFGLPRPGNNYQHACFSWIRRGTGEGAEGRRELPATEATEPAALFGEQERMRLACGGDGSAAHAFNLLRQSEKEREGRREREREGTRGFCLNFSFILGQRK